MYIESEFTRCMDRSDVLSANSVCSGTTTRFKPVPGPSVTSHSCSWRSASEPDRSVDDTATNADSNGSDPNQRQQFVSRCPWSCTHRIEYVQCPWSLFIFCDDIRLTFSVMDSEQGVSVWWSPDILPRSNPTTASRTDDETTNTVFISWSICLFGAGGSL